MPYTKKKSSYTSKATTSKSVASLVTKVNTMMKNHRPELKVYDVTLTTNIPAVGSVNGLTNGIVAGTGQTNRTGHQISVKSNTFKGEIAWNPTASKNGVVSLYIIQDLQQIADGDPVFTDIFNFGAGTLSVLNRETLGRFKILYKKKIVQDGERVSLIDFHLKSNINVRYNGVQSDIQKNGIFLVLCSNQLSFPPIIHWFSRITYTDN
jgi:hypothetical protein